MFDDENEVKGLTFSKTVTLGQALQAGAILVAVIVWATTASSKADQAARDVSEFKTEMTGQMSDLRITLDRGLQNVQQQIAAIPTYGARIDQLEKNQASLGSSMGVLDTRLRAVENQTAIDNSRLDNIERASNVPLGKQGR